MKAKLISAIFLTALIVPCYAGTDCTGCDQSTKRAPERVPSGTEKTQLTKHSRSTISHRENKGFCRDFHCVYASGTPWWPGAPGD